MQHFDAGYFLSQIGQENVLLIISVVITGIIFYLSRKILIFKTVVQKQKVFLELTPPALTEKSAYTTQQLFSVLHQIGNQRTFIEKLLGRKVSFSFEIVSTRAQGIRYIIQTTPEEADIVQKSLRAYLPYVQIKKVVDYLPTDSSQAKVIEFKLKKHFALPLAKQDLLNEHDPVAYITGIMTKLSSNELIAFQIVLSPNRTEAINTLSQKILNNEDVLYHLTKSSLPWYLRLISLLITSLIQAVQFVIWEIIDILIVSSQRSPHKQINTSQQQQILKRERPARVLSKFEQDAVSSIQEKINQPLFETTIRAFIIVDKKQAKQEIRGVKSSLAPFASKYQSLQAKSNMPLFLMNRIRLWSYKHRVLSLFHNRSHLILSASEIADLYHFPYTQTTKTENIAKAYSKELPAPLSLKRGRKLDVVFGENFYGGTSTDIGLTKEERATHAYLIGRTGSGKTTLMYSMSMHDITNGNGMAFVDPHGDISEDLLAIIPEERKQDVIYFNPIDLKHPIGINLLELTPGLDEDEAELEKEVVAEGVISLFRKVFSKDEQGNAHRIEYILRNTIYTAFTVEDATLFTLYDILNNPPFQKQVIAKLEDENLKNFWKYEFGKAGDYQSVKMASGVTAKVGRFLFSPTAKRILEQKKSTIDFNAIMNEGKILICNVSQGNLGEDTARLLGTTILTKIQQAALRRSRIAKNQRRPFYLYVDEFQNFATNSFIKLLSEGRKYGLSVTIAEQSTAQQEDRNIVNNILANVTTVICFRSANPIDEQLMLTQFSPFVEKGDITNLPRYQFYIKISALEPEETFSGKTIFISIIRDEKKIQRLIQSSRDQYAIIYQKIASKQKKSILKKEGDIKDDSNKEEANNEELGALPEYH